MKKGTKMLAILLSAILLGSTFAGCGNGQNLPSKTSGEGNEFTYWSTMPADIVSHYQTLAEVTMYKELEELTGTKIKFIHPASGQQAEQFNLMIASRELPDLMEYTWNNYPGGPEKAINDNIIMKLNDLIENHTPNLNKAFAENKDYVKDSITDNGTYYAFPGLNMGSYRTFGGLMIRQDWLDDLGLDVPATIDDWENVLTAFKEQKNASAPFTANLEMFDTKVIRPTFNNAYDVGQGIYVDNHKVKFGPIEPAYKEFITRMNQWYQAGLLDPEYFTNNSSAIEAKMTNGSSGAVFGFIGGAMGRYLTAMKDREPAYNLTAAPFPVKNIGDEPRFSEYQKEASPVLAITSACKDPEGVTKWVDFLYSEKGFEIKNFGKEGLTYNKVDGKYVYTDEILNNSANISISEAMGRHFRATSPSVGFNNPDDYLAQYYQFPQQLKALEVWSQYAHHAKSTTLPAITPTMDEVEELNSLNAEISTYLDEMILKFVTGTEDISRFDSFVETLKQMGIERIVALNQAAYDRYLEK